MNRIGRMKTIVWGFGFILIVLIIVPQCSHSALANNTPIATPTGIKVIQDFQIGDSVSIASIQSTENQLLPTWSSKTIALSQGTDPDSILPNMIHIQYGDNRTLIVSPDQLFLLPNGKLQRSDHLIPGQDSLVLADGTHVDIETLAIGQYRGSVHHIATSLNFDGTLDDHLINTNGIIAGDYTLQIYQSQLGDFLESDQNDLVLGFPEPVDNQSHTQFTLSPINLENTAPGAQQFPDVIYNSKDNTYLAVWEHAYSVDLYEIWGTILNGDTGQSTGSSTLLLMDEQSLEAPEVTYNSVDNEFLLVARRKSDNMVLAQRVSAQGQATGDVVELGRSGGPTFFDPASRARVTTVTYNAKDNRYLVGFGEPLSVQILLPDLSLDFISESLGTGTNPAASWSSQSNRYFLAWEDRETRNTGNENLSAVLITDYAEADSDVIHVRDQEFAEESPRVAYNPDDDQFLVVWDERIGFADNASPKTLTDTIGQIISADGTKIGDPIPIEAGTAYTLRQDVDYNPASEIYLVVWKGDLSGDFAFADIYGRVIKRDGTLDGEAFLIYDGGDDKTDLGTSEQYYDESKLPVVAANTQTGSFLVVWEESGTTQSPDSRDILSRMVSFSETGIFDWPLYE